MRVEPFFALARRDAGADRDDFRFGFRCRYEPVDPALEPEPVDENQPCARERAPVGGRRLIDMGVAIGTNDGGDFDATPADLAHEIAEN